MKLPIICTRCHSHFDAEVDVSSHPLPFTQNPDEHLPQALPPVDMICPFCGLHCGSEAIRATLRIIRAAAGGVELDREEKLRLADGIEGLARQLDDLPGAIDQLLRDQPKLSGLRRLVPQGQEIAFISLVVSLLTLLENTLADQRDLNATLFGEEAAHEDKLPGDAQERQEASQVPITVEVGPPSLWWEGRRFTMHGTTRPLDASESFIAFCFGATPNGRALRLGYLFLTRLNPGIWRLPMTVPKEFKIAFFGLAFCDRGALLKRVRHWEGRTVRGPVPLAKLPKLFDLPLAEGGLVWRLRMGGGYDPVRTSPEGNTMRDFMPRSWQPFNMS
ncbi:hypothetical protein FXF51_02160 [Nonomuraea sp. PA05]|uniref:hypothetical protein n=1 Tax=Nonomuraea sp. PA05 TaxID=2604466 RepID=UPI0011DA872F|nr:hypothetical protein [Nonomuraea sp. PA05]TYB71261.1 hypothetical protein FXF51_02160 [Nonomuraea sp. PA05]